MDFCMFCIIILQYKVQQNHDSAKVHVNHTCILNNYLNKEEVVHKGEGT